MKWLKKILKKKPKFNNQGIRTYWKNNRLIVESLKFQKDRNLNEVLK